MSVEKVNYRKHILRYSLLIVALLSIGCDDEDCMGPGTNFCGEQVTIDENIVLSAQNPTARYVTGEACPAGELFFQVNYQYADSPSSSEKDRPPITVKFGTLEKGVINNNQINKPQYISGDGRWAQGIGMYHYPATKKDNPDIIHWAVTVTLQKPLVALPNSNAPTVRLPFIGTIIGPKSRDVKVNVYIKYLEPRKESTKK